MGDLFVSVDGKNFEPVEWRENLSEAVVSSESEFTKWKELEFGIKKLMKVDLYKESIEDNTVAIYLILNELKERYNINYVIERDMDPMFGYFIRTFRFFSSDNKLLHQFRIDML